MHGRKKRTTPITDEEREKTKKDVLKARALMDKLLDMRANKVYDNVANEMTLTAIQYNPDMPTFWNFRREMLMDKGLVQDGLTNELDVVQNALKKGPKAYCVWFHRRWLITKLLELVEDGEALITSELGLCDQFFALDCRNFHCWNYRHFLLEINRKRALEESEEAEQLMRQKQDEINLETSKKLVEKDFSNYSAWHQRSLVEKIRTAAELRDYDFMQTELKWLMNGLYTEPEDQSLWLYHSWFVDTFCRCAHGQLMGHAVYAPPGENAVVRLIFSKPVTVDVHNSAVAIGSGSVDGSWKPLIFQDRVVKEVWCFHPEGSPLQAGEQLDLSVKFLSNAQADIEYLVTVPDSSSPNHVRDVETPLDEELRGILENEVEMIEMLYEEEEECKYIVLALVRLKKILDEEALHGVNLDFTASYDKLVALDPQRKYCYVDASKRDQMMREIRRVLRECPETLLV